jgi:hypothetical protein
MLSSTTEPWFYFLSENIPAFVQPGRGGGRRRRREASTISLQNNPVFLDRSEGAIAMKHRCKYSRSGFPTEWESAASLIDNSIQIEKTLNNRNGGFNMMETCQSGYPCR